MRDEIRILPFGACQLSPPLGTVTGAVSSFSPLGLTPVSTYTTAEAIQTVWFFRGELYIPDDLRYYCNLPEQFDPMASYGRRIEQADIVLLEPNSPVVTVFEGYALNRSTLLTGFLNAVCEAGDDQVKRAGTAWFLQGLFACNEEVKRDTAEALISHLSGRVDNEALVRELLRGVHGERQDFEAYVASIAEIRDMLAPPTALVAYIHSFMPDGRALPWPPDFLEQTEQAAARLGLPLFDPTELVQHHGVETALIDIRTIYREEFYPVAGQAILDFARSVLSSQPAERIPVILHRTQRGGGRRRIPRE